MFFSLGSLYRTARSSSNEVTRLYECSLPALCRFTTVTFAAAAGILPSTAPIAVVP